MTLQGVAMLFVAWILATTSCHYPVQAQYTNIQTATGTDYFLSTYNTTNNEAIRDCAVIGLGVAKFGTNTEYQAFLDELNSTAPAAASYENNIWIRINKKGSRFFFGGEGEEINSSYWSPGEPDGLCGSSCCYLIQYNYNITANDRFLADDDCDESYHFLCTGTNETVITTEATTADAPTMAASTTTTATTIMVTSSSTPDTTTTISTASPTTLTTTAATTSTTTAVGTTSSATSTVTTPTTPPPVTVELSTGEQMTVIYLGLVIGLSLGISCVCSLCWVVVNRTRRRRQKAREGDGGDGDECGKGNNDDGGGEEDDGFQDGNNLDTIDIESQV